MAARSASVDTGAFALAGDLHSTDVAAIDQRTQASCRAGNLPERIDLSALGQTDSSILALLLEWKDWALAHHHNIEFDEPPNSLLVLAGLSQVSELLGWETRARNDSDGEKT